MTHHETKIEYFTGAHVAEKASITINNYTNQHSGRVEVGVGARIGQGARITIGRKKADVPDAQVTSKVSDAQVTSKVSDAQVTSKVSVGSNITVGKGETLNVGSITVVQQV